MEADTVGGPHTKPPDRERERSDETNRTDAITVLAEANARLSETIVAQGDQLIQLHQQLDRLRGA